MIVTETVILATEGERKFDAYLALPASGRKPGILIMTEMFGVNGPMRSLADSYAAQGYPALVPHVFWRSNPSSALAYEGPERETAWERLSALDFDVIATDLRGAVRTLRAAPSCSGKVAVIGFCAGGRLSYLVAARAGVDAAVSFYALGISRHLDEMPKISCPLQLHYGTKDEHVPMSEMKAVSDSARGRANVEIHLYDAGHSFFNRVRPTYDSEAADLAERRVTQLLLGL